MVSSQKYREQLCEPTVIFNAKPRCPLNLCASSYAGYWLIDGKWEKSVETLYNGPRRHEVNLFAILANGGLVHDDVCVYATKVNRRGLPGLST